MAAEQLCPGICNIAYQRERNAYDQAMTLYDPLDSSQSRPEPPALRPSYGDPWCGKCHVIIAWQLYDLDDLAPLRNLTADGHDSDTSPAKGHHASSEPTSPSPEGDDSDDTYKMLWGWELEYRRLKGYPPSARRGVLAGKRTTCMAWLADHLGDILTSPIAEDFGKEIMSWHRDLKSKAKAGKRRLSKPLRCHNCKFLTLTWDEGGRYVQCWSCGVMLTYDEYEAEVERVARSIERGDLRENSNVALIA